MVASYTKVSKVWSISPLYPAPQLPLFQAWEFCGKLLCCPTWMQSLKAISLTGFVAWWENCHLWHRLLLNPLPGFSFCYPCDVEKPGFCVMCSFWALNVFLLWMQCKVLPLVFERFKITLLCHLLLLFSFIVACSFFPQYLTVVTPGYTQHQNLMK